MITLAELAREYRQPLIQDYGHLMRPEHYYALRALIDCRTPALPEVPASDEPSMVSPTATETAAGALFYGDLYLAL